jgi:hypothetical protein
MRVGSIFDWRMRRLNGLGVEYAELHFTCPQPNLTKTSVQSRATEIGGTVKSPTNICSSLCEPRVTRVGTAGHLRVREPGSAIALMAHSNFLLSLSSTSQLSGGSTVSADGRQTYLSLFAFSSQAAACLNRSSVFKFKLLPCVPTGVHARTRG